MASELQDKLTKQQITRREFLQITGAVLLGILGISRLITIATQLKSGDIEAVSKTTTDSNKGFGTRKFGA
ncbi:MAG TPA: hypothetical protein VK497_05030 [Candidatus Saccharimonadales bacterium]|nr:hypothetical protein [Candidatus Saccharimonadales bacterium]